MRYGNIKQVKKMREKQKRKTRKIHQENRRKNRPGKETRCEQVCKNPGVD